MNFLEHNIDSKKSRPFELMVFKSNQHIYAHIIDRNTTNGHILASASTIEKAYKLNFSHLNQTESAKKIGALIAARALKLGIDQVVLNLKKKQFGTKNSKKTYRFQGKVKMLVSEMVGSGVSIKKK